MTSPEQQGGEAVNAAPWPTLDNGMQVLEDIRQALLGDGPLIDEDTGKKTWMTSEFPSVVDEEIFTVATENTDTPILIMRFGEESYRFTMDGDWLRLHPKESLDREPDKPTLRLDSKMVNGLAGFAETVRLNRSADNTSPDYHAYDELFAKLSQQQKALAAIGLMSVEESDV